MDQIRHRKQIYTNQSSVKGFVVLFVFAALAATACILPRVAFAQGQEAGDQPAQAPKKMDINTHNVVIEKLQFAFDNAPGKSAQRAALALRLADLRAERARLTQKKIE